MTTIDLFRNSTDAIMFEAGQIIFAEGQPGEAMYAVIEGEIDVSFHGHHLATIEPGGIIGEMALIESGPRTATARARTDCKVVPVDERRFTYMVQQTPSFALKVMRIMAERLERMNEMTAA